mmetsp:Transcript_29728/g.86929  ORF Transcript_29728/g.86929 Transcript_29728/m.86929 type:complete len:166 (+) Transcript_29728:1-498(+)
MQSAEWLRTEVDKITERARSGVASDSTAAAAEQRGAKRKEPSTGAAAAVEEFSARHLLVKFQGSRKAVSHRTGLSTEDVTAEQALEELHKFEKRIQDAGATQEAFESCALERSDCKSFSRGGDLGTFLAGKMQKAFEAATRSTPIGKMSPVVLTDSGYHLIFRYR